MTFSCVIVAILVAVFGFVCFIWGRQTINKKRWSGEFAVLFSDESEFSGKSGITARFTRKTDEKIVVVYLLGATPGMLPSVEVFCGNEPVSYYPTTDGNLVTLVLDKPIGVTSEVGKTGIEISFERDPGLFEVVKIDLEPAEKGVAPSTPTH